MPAHHLDTFPGCMVSTFTFLLPSWPPQKHLSQQISSDLKTVHVALLVVHLFSKYLMSIYYELDAMETYIEKVKL